MWHSKAKPEGKQVQAWWLVSSPKQRPCVHVCLFHSETAFTTDKEGLAGLWRELSRFTRHVFYPHNKTSLCHFCQEFGWHLDTSSSILQPWNYIGILQKSPTASFLNISWGVMEACFSWAAVMNRISLIKTWNPTAGERGKLGQPHCKLSKLFKAEKEYLPLKCYPIIELISLFISHAVTDKSAK